MKEFQDFEIVKRIGSGATSDVYLAMDPEGNRRALKVFNQFLPEDQANKTFQREMESLEQLRNDKIVSVYGLEKNNNNSWVLIQEYIEGQSLKSYLEETNPSKLDRVIIALSVASEVLYALEESHAKGIIHRDIKTENILIDTFKNRVVLSDFGLSKNIKAKDQTMHGNMFGSPQYMSLSQYSNDKVSTEMDLYGLCVLMYEIIAGVAPFKGEHLDEIIMAKKDGRFSPLSKNNHYTPLKLVHIINAFLKNDEEAKKNYNRSFKMRFELLNILHEFDLDAIATVPLICQGKDMLSKAQQVYCIGKVLEELEMAFDQEAEKKKKVLLLDQILHIDPSNKRGKKKKRGYLWFLIPLLIIGALGTAYYTQRKSPAVVTSPEVKVVKDKTSTSAPREEIKKEEVAAKPVQKQTSEAKKTAALTNTKTKAKTKDITKVKPKAKPEPVPAKLQVGYLIVKIPSDIKVFVNDKRIFDLGKKLPYKPGEYEVTLAKAGHPSMSSTITIVAGEETIIKLN